MKEVEGKKVMVELMEVVGERLAVAEQTVVVVELQEGVKGSLAVAGGEETPQGVLAEEEEEVAGCGNGRARFALLADDSPASRR